MTKQIHTKTSEEHEAPAKSPRTAPQSHEKGESEAEGHSKKGDKSSTKAHAASTEVPGKTTAKKK